MAAVLLLFVLSCVFGAGSASAASSPGTAHGQAVQAVQEAIGSFQESVDVSGYGLSADETAAFMEEVIYTDPMLFYLKTYQCSQKNGSVTTIRLNYTDSVSVIQRKIGEVEEAAREITDQIDVSSLSEEETALALHDILAARTAYSDSAGQEACYTIYGALVNREAVCQGYVCAYSYLLEQCGIRQTVACSEALNHIWNLVEVDGSWYHVDVSGDDPPSDNLGRAQHSLFLVSTSDFLEGTAVGKKDARDMVIYGEEEISIAETSFSDVLWGRSEAAMYYVNGYWYAADNAAGKVEKIRYDDRKVQVSTVKKIGKAWVSDPDGEETYDEAFIRLGVQGRYLYFTGPKKLYRLNTKTGTVQIVSRLASDAGVSFYGLASLGGDLYIVKNAQPYLSESWSKLRPLEGDTLTLSYKKTTYTGKKKKPSVTVTDGSSRVKSTYYIVTYTDNRNAGKASAHVTGNAAKNRYGRLSASFTIQKAAQRVRASVPKSTLYVGRSGQNTEKITVDADGKGKITASFRSNNRKVVSVSSTGRIRAKSAGSAVIRVRIRAGSTGNYEAAVRTVRLTITVKELAAPEIRSVRNTGPGKVKVRLKARVKGADGYQIRTSLVRRTSVQRIGSVKISGSKNLRKTLSGLPAGKTVRIRVRSYKKIGSTVWSSWSPPKIIKIVK